jgi:hypothetical protein
LAGVTGGTWRRLLETAIHAPSPHNVQPWRVRIIDDATAELLIEKARTLPNEDLTGSFIILTMGLFIESLRLVAAHYRLAVDDALIEEPRAFAADRLALRREPLIPFARLTLRSDPGALAEFPLPLFHERRTSRLPYRLDPVAPAALETLARTAIAWGQRYEQTRHPARIERLLDWNIDAVFADLNHAPYHDEMMGWLRYTNGQSARHRDGLDARCMNTSPHELWTAFHAAPLLRWPLTRGWFRRRYRDQIGPVATLGFLSGPFWDPAEAFRTGRFLIRFWLECTRLGYYFHPYGNLVTHRPTAARVEAELKLQDIWLAFKIGRSDPPPKSHRRSVQAIEVA